MVDQTTKDWTGLSSQVLRTTYDEDKQQMTVQYAFSAWVYSKVTREMWAESLNVDSIGKFINKTIKPNCSANKIG